jgi:hypothetical protein
LHAPPHICKRLFHAIMVCKMDPAMKKALPSQGVFQDASDRRARDGGFDMLLAVSGRLVRVESVAGGRATRAKPLADILFAHGRRTVTTWLRAAGVSPDFQDYYHFLVTLGRKTKSVATRLLLLVLRTMPLADRLLAVIDDTSTKRYGPKVEGAGIHHRIASFRLKACWSARRPR